MRSTATVTAKTKTLILDFSRAYPDAGFLEMLPGASVLDLSSLEGTVCYCDPGAAAKIKAALAGREEKIHWIDSGDFHYVTKLFTDALAEPFTLVLFDHHPDDQAPEFEGVLSCGSWVAAMKAENPWLEAVCSVGPESETGLQGIDGRKVWLSIDKDVLDRAYARTDWSQGEHTPAQVCGMLEALIGPMKLAAIDICGGITPEKGATPEDLRLNRETDIALYQFLSGLYL